MINYFYTQKYYDGKLLYLVNKTFVLHTRM